MGLLFAGTFGGPLKGHSAVNLKSKGLRPYGRASWGRNIVCTLRGLLDVGRLQMRGGDELEKGITGTPGQKSAVPVRPPRSHPRPCSPGALPRATPTPGSSCSDSTPCHHPRPRGGCSSFSALPAPGAAPEKSARAGQRWGPDRDAGTLPVGRACSRGGRRGQEGAGGRVPVGQEGPGGGRESMRPGLGAAGLVLEKPRGPEPEWGQEP